MSRDNAIDIAQNAVKMAVLAGSFLCCVRRTAFDILWRLFLTCSVFTGGVMMNLSVIPFAAMVFACVSTAQGLEMDCVAVGNPGNANDIHGDGYGGVDYVYHIGMFEVTAGQYAEFLNAVANEDTYDLYSANMWNSSRGCRIERTGTSPNYMYNVAEDWADRPVNYVSWGDAARFANWLHNGQPSGIQDLTTTEDGSYYLNGAMSTPEILAVRRKAAATWVIPSEDEWYKAAYHQNDGVTGNYWDFPTSTDAVPNNGNPEGDTGNSANFYDGDHTIGSPYWRTEIGFFSLSVGPYGTFDQFGNVWEWNEAVIGMDRGVRGGSFGGYLRDAYRDNDYLTSAAGLDIVGFRLVEVSKYGCDFDGDGDVDLKDYARFLNCFSGEGNGVSADCERCDSEPDEDFDLHDYEQFLLDFDGP